MTNHQVTDIELSRLAGQEARSPDGYEPELYARHLWGFESTTAAAQGFATSAAYVVQSIIRDCGVTGYNLRSFDKINRQIRTGAIATVRRFEVKLLQAGKVRRMMPYSCPRADVRPGLHFDPALLPGLCSAGPEPLRSDLCPARRWRREAGCVPWSQHRADSANHN